MMGYIPGNIRERSLLRAGQCRRDRAVSRGVSRFGARRDRRRLLACEIRERIRIGHVDRVIVRVFLRFLAGRFAHELRLDVHVWSPTIRFCQPVRAFKRIARLLHALHGREQDVGRLRGEYLAVARLRRGHDGRSRLLHRQRVGRKTRHIEKVALPIEFWTTFQELRVNLEPLDAPIIATLAIQRDAVQLELVRISSAYDVESRPAVTCMIDRGNRLRRKRRRDKRYVRGHEDADVFGQRAERRSLGERLEGTSPHVGLAAETVPFCDRQQEFHATSSAIVATATISSQSARQRSAAQLGVIPPAQLSPKRPNLNVLAPKNCPIPLHSYT